MSPNKKIDLKTSKVIYGSDDRIEIKEWDGEAELKGWQEAFLIGKRGNKKGSKTFSLCEEERFREQKRELFAQVY